jgi:hypothetical protein
METMAVRKDGKHVKRGERVTDFRGTHWTFRGNNERRVFVVPESEPDASGESPNEMSREFFPSVFGLELVGFVRCRCGGLIRYTSGECDTCQDADPIA